MLSLINYCYITLREILRQGDGPELLVYITEDKGFILTDHHSVSIMINTKPHYNKKVLLIDPKNIAPAYEFLSSNIHTSIYEMAKKNGHMVDVDGKQIKLPKYRRRLKTAEHKQAISKLQKKREKENQAVRDAMRTLFAKRASKNIARRVLQPSGIELINTVEYEPVDWEQKSFILNSYVFNNVCEYFYNESRHEGTPNFNDLGPKCQKEIIEGVYLNKLVKNVISLPIEFYSRIQESLHLFYPEIGGVERYVRLDLTNNTVEMLYVENKRRLNLAIHTFPANVNQRIHILKDKEMVLKIPHLKLTSDELVSNELCIYTDKDGNILKATYDIIAAKKERDPCLIYLTLDLGIAQKKCHESNAVSYFMNELSWGHIPSIESYHKKVVEHIHPKKELLNNLLPSTDSFGDIGSSLYNTDMYFYAMYLVENFSPVYVILYVDNYAKVITQVTVKCADDEMYNKFTPEFFVEIISSLFFEKITLSEWQDKYSSENYIRNVMEHENSGKNIFFKVYQGKDTPRWSNRGKSTSKLELCTECPLSFVGVAKLPNTAGLVESYSTLHYTDKTDLYLKTLGKCPVIFEDGPLKSRVKTPGSEMVIVHNLEYTKYISRLADLPFSEKDLHNWNTLNESWGVHKNKFKMEKHGPLPDLFLDTARKHWDKLIHDSIAGYELGFRTAPFYNALFNIRK